MSSMQPGNPLYQLASEPAAATPQHHYNTWSSSSTSRSSHQKSQSLPHGPGSSRHTLGSRHIAPLASPFHVPDEDPFTNHASAASRAPNPPSMYQPARSTNDPPWQIHAPRPMSGSMKRRADFDLGEDLVSPNFENNRHLQNIFPTHDSLPYDGNKRARVRGFSMGAMRHATSGHQSQATRQLTDLFNDPSSEQPTASGASEVPAAPPSRGTTTVGNMIGLGRLAPPSSYRPPRLASPFAPAAQANPGFSHTFPRSLFPHGLDSIASMEHQRPQMQVHTGQFGSDGSDESNYHGRPDTPRQG